MKKIIVRLTFVFLFVSLLHNAAQAVSYNIALNTTSLSGMNGQLAFDLINGDGVNNNSVVISAFTTNGTLGAATILGGVSGSLPSAVTMSDTAFFNELLNSITLGTTISFNLDLTTNFAGGIPDSFSFFILDDTASSSLVMTNLLGDALFAIDMNGTSTGALSVVNLTQPSLPLTVTPVPEPNSLLLLGLGVTVVFRRECRRFLALGF